MAEGYVKREIVIDVLRAHGVDVSLREGTTDMWVLAKDKIIEVHQLNCYVSRKVLHHFQYKFSIPIHHFYNPHIILPATKQIC
jgi:hypothetical protein